MRKTPPEPVVCNDGGYICDKCQATTDVLVSIPCYNAFRDGEEYYTELCPQCIQAMHAQATTAPQPRFNKEDAMHTELTEEQKDLTASLFTEVGYPNLTAAKMAAETLSQITNRVYRAAHSIECDNCDYFIELYNEDFIVDGDRVVWF